MKRRHETEKETQVNKRISLCGSLSPFVKNLLVLTPLPVELIKLIQQYLPVYAFGTIEKEGRYHFMVWEQNEAKWTSLFDVPNNVLGFSTTLIHDQYVVIAPHRIKESGLQYTCDLSVPCQQKKLSGAFSQYGHDITNYDDKICEIAMNLTTSETTLFTYSALNLPRTLSLYTVPMPRLYASIIVHDHYLYLFGGRRYVNGKHRYVSVCERFDLIHKTWATISDIPTVRSSAKSVIWNYDTIAVMGGIRKEIEKNLAYPISNELEKKLDIVELYHVPSDKWLVCDWKLPIPMTIHWAQYIWYTEQLMIVPDNTCDIYILNNKKEWTLIKHL